MVGKGGERGESFVTYKYPSISILLIIILKNFKVDF
jgi:hypothetical protein